MAKLAVGNQDQPTTEKQLVKSMDFSHAFSSTSKVVLNTFLQTLSTAPNQISQVTIDCGVAFHAPSVIYRSCLYDMFAGFSSKRTNFLPQR
jgi:hypothetical protein